MAVFVGKLLSVVCHIGCQIRKVANTKKSFCFFSNPVFFIHCFFLRFERNVYEISSFFLKAIPGGLT